MNRSDTQAAERCSAAPSVRGLRVSGMSGITERQKFRLCFIIFPEQSAVTLVGDNC